MSSTFSAKTVTQLGGSSPRIPTIQLDVQNQTRFINIPIHRRSGAIPNPTYGAYLISFPQISYPAMAAKAVVSTNAT